MIMFPGREGEKVSNRQHMTCIGFICALTEQRRLMALNGSPVACSLPSISSEYQSWVTTQ